MAARLTPLPQLLGAPAEAEREAERAKAALRERGRAIAEDRALGAAMPSGDTLADKGSSELPDHETEPFQAASALIKAQRLPKVPPGLASFANDGWQIPPTLRRLGARKRIFRGFAGLARLLDYSWYPTAQLKGEAGKKGD